MPRRDPDLYGPRDFNPDRLKEAVDALNAEVPDLEETDFSTLTDTKRRNLSKMVREAVLRLEPLVVALDPIGTPETVFDPGDPKMVSRLIASALMDQSARPMSGLARFYGSGVYAIYYRGDFDAYAPISGKETPIYIGKADPKEDAAKTVQDQGAALYERLQKHKSNLSKPTNLAIADFDYRYLVVNSTYQYAAEQYLMEHFKPVWNFVCSGFGKHGDNPTVRANTISDWDTLHPGREWATRAGNVRSEKTEDQIKQEIAAHFERHPPQR